MFIVTSIKFHLFWTVVQIEKKKLAKSSRFSAVYSIDFVSKYRHSYMHRFCILDSPTTFWLNYCKALILQNVTRRNYTLLKYLKIHCVLVAEAIWKKNEKIRGKKNNSNVRILFYAVQPIGFIYSAVRNTHSYYISNFIGDNRCAMMDKIFCFWPFFVHSMHVRFLIWFNLP